MKEELKSRCEKFVNNRDVIKNCFKWENANIVAVCALEACKKNVCLDELKLLECKKILEDATGVFSEFRGMAKLPVICMLAMTEDSKALMDKAVEIHELLKLKFRNSQYLILLAIRLANMISVDEVNQYADRGKTIYNLMKKEHPFLTSVEDNVFAVLLAFSQKADEELVADMEECYRTMKKFSYDSNGMQSLSHVFALANGTPEDKCAKVIEIFNKFDEKGKKYGKTYEMVVLGSVSVMCDNIDEIIENVMEIDEYLSTVKGYTGLGIDKKTRLMHALMLATDGQTENDVVNTAAFTGTMSMIAAQNAAMCAVIASTVAINVSN